MDGGHDDDPPVAGGAEGGPCVAREEERAREQEGDERDYFVPAGKSFRVSRDGLTLIAAIHRSAIALASPAAL